MYNTENYIQYLVITYKDKVSEEEYDIYNYFAEHLKLTHYCKSTTFQI